MSADVVKLIDPTTGATASVIPSVGFNCFSFRPVSNGEPVELLWSESGFDFGRGRPTRSGIPILFPFPGRLSGSTLRFGDREIPLVIDPKQECAIHGFVHSRPWRVLETRPASVTGEFHAATDDAELLKLWPADFRIRVCYELNAGRLESTLTVDNPGDSPLPFGLGTHGYFRVPLSENPAGRDDCRVYAPVRKFWELQKMFPTGKTLPADGAKNLAAGIPYGQTQLDDVFTDLVSQGGKIICHVDDPTNRRHVVLEFDESFGECVVFDPPHREAICIEPYTCAPDAYKLTDRGIDAGLKILQPGESFQTRVSMRLEQLT